MTSFVTSVDGTRIAFDRLGEGPTVILVGGMLCHRRTTRQLAERLARRFTVINYDRRGRGESGDTPPYTVRRETEDLAALIAASGGSAAVYGYSSGAGIALNAASHGLPITHVVLHEPHDLQVLGDVVGATDIPTLVIAGGASPEVFRDIAIRIAYMLPNGTYTRLEGQDGGAPAELVAPVVTEFLTAASSVAAGMGGRHTPR